MTPPSKWAVGQRVAAYQYETRYVGKISHIYESGRIEVTHSGNTCIGAFHPKQLRRLKPKAKPSRERREWWIGCGIIGEPVNYGKVSAFFYGPSDPRQSNTLYNVKEWFHVTELQEGDVLVNREMLAKVFFEDISIGNEESFKWLCNRIGLPAAEQSEANQKARKA